MDDALDTGDILLGTLGTVFANRLGGFRPGILAAAVNIPEPTAAVLILLGGMALLAFPVARSMRHFRFASLLGLVRL